MYQVIDTHTGEVIGKSLPASAARRKRDRLDQIYGTVRYTVKEVK